MLVSDLYVEAEGERRGREGEEMEDDDELDHVCPFFFSYWQQPSKES